MRAPDLTPERMKKGGRYNWTHDPHTPLVYLGHNWSGNGYWHQFAKVGSPDDVWCEVLTADLRMLEESIEPLDLSFAERPAAVKPAAPRREPVEPKQQHQKEGDTPDDHARILAAAERRAKRNAKHAKKEQGHE